MRSSFTMFVVFTIVVYLGHASTASFDGSSESSPSFYKKLQHCVKNNDYPQIIQLLKKCKDGEIQLKPQELIQCFYTMLQPSLSKLMSNTSPGEEEEIFLHELGVGTRLFLNALLSGNIHGVLDATVKGTVEGIDYGLYGLMDGINNGLKNGDLLGGAVKGVTQLMGIGNIGGVKGIREGLAESAN